jgi:cytochrome c553
MHMNVFNRFSLSAFALLFCGLSTGHAQQNAAALHQRANAAMCANCHGTEGKTVDGSAVPSINGMPKDYMVLQMKAFKDGTRPATVMHQLTKGLTDAQIESIAIYYANNKR